MAFPENGVQSVFAGGDGVGLVEEDVVAVVANMRCRAETDIAADVEHIVPAAMIHRLRTVRQERQQIGILIAAKTK